MVYQSNKRNKWIAGILVSLVLICCVCPCIASLSDTTKTPISSGATFAVKPPTAFKTPINTLAPFVGTTQLTRKTETPEPTKRIPTGTETQTTPTALLLPTQIPSTVQVSGNIQVSFVDVGQGDSILIRSPEGLFGLIDGGETDSGIIQYLRSQGVQNLDLVIATHPNSDHIGGLIAVLGTFPTARVVTNGEMHTTATYENFLDAIATSRAEYIEVSTGNTLSLGSLTLNVLSPNRIVGDDLNRNSIVLRMTFGTTTFLFTGDAKNDTEAEMIGAGLPLSANILKLGHHGSCTSTSSAFLAKVIPEVAIYSAGSGNSFGNPCPDTLNRLSGVQVFLPGEVFYQEVHRHFFQTLPKFLPPDIFLPIPQPIILYQPTAALSFRDSIRVYQLY